ncbi:MAG TPA: MaoC/PaaZ C-terminal domain-containing protein [Pseudonocardiaceae bacterium]|nr:MaoC/PaaZ C-terminal domain-containing protein [Pseudonocardiaceae bacterium]
MTVREVDGAPNLGPLLAKAALSGLRRSPGEELPAAGYAQSGVVADRAKLAEYARVCGFRVSDELPVTYPHVLAFPLQTKLMTDADFPFPLLGLVHVANRITRLRPVRADEPLVLRVRADNLRPHERGQQFDVLTEVRVDGALVWTEASTYLRRDGSASAAAPSAAAPSAATPAAAAPSAAAPSAAAPSAAASPERPVAVWPVPADTGRRYAHVSGDHNPIHLHALSAKPFGFPRAIAHGMWSLARCLAFFDTRLPDACTVEARFKRPISLPGTVALSTEVGDSGFGFALSGAKSGKPHLVGTVAG